MNARDKLGCKISKGEFVVYTENDRVNVGLVVDIKSRVYQIGKDREKIVPYLRMLIPSIKWDKDNKTFVGITKRTTIYNPQTKMIRASDDCLEAMLDSTDEYVRTSAKLIEKTIEGMGSYQHLKAV